MGTLATSISEDAGTLEEVYEPFLIKEGFLIRTQRGRVATDLAYQHLGMESCLPQRKYNPEKNTVYPFSGAGGRAGAGVHVGDYQREGQGRWEAGDDEAPGYEP